MQCEYNITEFIYRTAQKNMDILSSTDGNQKNIFSYVMHFLDELNFHVLCIKFMYKAAKKNSNSLPSVGNE